MPAVLRGSCNKIHLSGNVLWKLPSVPFQLWAKPGKSCLAHGWKASNLPRNCCLLRIQRQQQLDWHTFVKSTERTIKGITAVFWHPWHFPWSPLIWHTFAAWTWAWATQPKSAGTSQHVCTKLFASDFFQVQNTISEHTCQHNLVLFSFWHTAGQRETNCFLYNFCATKILRMRKNSVKRFGHPQQTW